MLELDCPQVLEVQAQVQEPLQLLLLEQVLELLVQDRQLQPLELLLVQPQPQSSPIMYWEEED